MKISRSVYDNKQHSPNFTSRIAPIRDAQWVCNTINTAFPHLSPTKFKIIFEHYIQKNGAKESVPVFKSYNDIYFYIKSQLNSKQESFFEKIKQKFCTTKFQKKMNTFAVIEKYMERIDYKIAYYNEVIAHGEKGIWDRNPGLKAARERIYGKKG